MNRPRLPGLDSILFLILTMFAGPGYPLLHAVERPTQDHSPTFKRMPLHQFLHYYEDPSRTATLEEITSLAEKDWQENPAKDVALNKKFSRSVFWLRFDLRGLLKNHAEDLVFSSAYPLGDRMDFYVKQKDGSFISVIAGDRVVDNGARLIKGRLPALLVKASEDEGLFFIRFDTQGTYLFNFRLESPESFRATESQDLIVFGIFVGVCVAMILYNLFIFLTFNNSTYLVYIIAIFCLMMNSLGFSGMFNVFVPLNFYLANEGYVVAAGVSNIASVVFCFMFLDMRLKSKFGYTFGLVIAICVLTIALTHISYTHGAALVSVVGIINPIVLLTAGLQSCLKKFRPAYFYSLAWLMLLLGSVGTGLQVYNIVKPNFISEWGQLFGVMLESILISMALGDKIKYFQAKSKREIKQLNEGLERKVIEKTHEIRALLDHIPQGVCSIETGAVLAKDYSAHLADILGTDSISGKNLEQLILSNSSLTIDEKDQVMQIINSVIGDDALNFELNCGNLPTEICYTPGSEDKYLKATWNVEVAADNRVQRILLTLLDVSHEKVLEQKNKEQAQLLELVKELIDITAERAAQFFATGLPLLQENQRIIDNAELDLTTLRLLFVNAHTVKGAARTLQLKSLAAAIHKAEDSLSAMIKGGINQLF